MARAGDPIVVPGCPALWRRLVLRSLPRARDPIVAAGYTALSRGLESHSCALSYCRGLCRGDVGRLSVRASSPPCAGACGDATGEDAGSAPKRHRRRG